MAAGVKESVETSAQLCGWTESLDVTPPSAPAKVVAETQSSGVIAVTWDASADDREFSHYVVLHVPAALGQPGRLGAPYGIGTSETPGFTATPLNAGTEYCFQVRAVDASGNTADSAEKACASTFPSDEASWRFRIGCRSEAYRYEGSFDLGEYARAVVDWGDGTDYDGETQVVWALAGTYDPARGLEGEILWQGAEFERQDRFNAELSSDDTSDIGNVEERRRRVRCRGALSQARQRRGPR